MDATLNPHPSRQSRGEVLAHLIYQFCHSDPSASFQPWKPGVDPMHAKHQLCHALADAAQAYNATLTYEHMLAAADYCEAQYAKSEFASELKHLVTVLTDRR